MTDIYAVLKQKALAMMREHGLAGVSVQVKARALSPTEAIGHPEDDDYPIQKGKERLMHAEIQGAFGQAFTDHFGDYEGTLESILTAPLTNNYRRAVFIAALNATLRRLGHIDGTEHCHDDAPVQCAEAMSEDFFSRYGKVNITLIGLQPRMVEHLAPRFPLRVIDMDPGNIGSQKYGTLIESPDNTPAAIDWADLLVVTGTTIVNGTLSNFLGHKPVVFYGTTIAGAAYLMGWERFCAKST